MRQPKLGSSSLHAYVQCVAMSGASALQLLESRPSMCGRGVASAGEGGVNRRRCIEARRLVTALTHGRSAFQQLQRARARHGDALYIRMQGGGTELWLTHCFAKGNQTGHREPAGSGRSECPMRIEPEMQR